MTGVDRFTSLLPWDIATPTMSTVHLCRTQVHTSDNLPWSYLGRHTTGSLPEVALVPCSLPHNMKIHVYSTLAKTVKKKEQPIPNTLPIHFTQTAQSTALLSSEEDTSRSKAWGYFRGCEVILPLTSCTIYYYSIPPKGCVWFTLINQEKSRNPYSGHISLLERRANSVNRVHLETHPH